MAALVALPAVLIAVWAVRAVQRHSQPAPTPGKVILAPRAGIALDPTPPSPSVKAAALDRAVTFPNSVNVFDLVASPVKNQLLVQWQLGSDGDSEGNPFGGLLHFVDLSSTQTIAKEIVGGNNVVSSSTPVWDPTGSVAYFAYESEACSVSVGPSVCGIFTYDSRTGKIARVLGDSTRGLAISPDGSLLAFWDYTFGNSWRSLTCKPIPSSIPGPAKFMILMTPRSLTLPSCPTANRSSLPRSAATTCP